MAERQADRGVADDRGSPAGETGRHTRHHDQQPEHCGNAGAACPATAPAGLDRDKEAAREINREARANEKG